MSGAFASLRSAVRRLPLYRAARKRFTPEGQPGLRLTPKRILNYNRVRRERAAGVAKLTGYPLTLTVEATNVCNLRCPGCFTGIGEQGRVRSMLHMPLYEQILDELGDRLLMLEFYNWGEPLLNKNITKMVRMASDKGISTLISSNLSVPMDETQAEALVASGLARIGCSIDGATQETYEKYRVRGQLDLILRNIDLLNAAKRKLGSETPYLVWEFHQFAHNVHEQEMAAAMAAERGMLFAASKGWVAGEDWDPEGKYEPGYTTDIQRCDFLWQRAVINNDGGVAPCCATFFNSDDFGSLRVSGEPSIAPSDLEAATTFREVWNNRKFMVAREMFTNRSATPPEERSVCYDCPVTVTWEKFAAHRKSGRSQESFVRPYRFNDGFNYFFEYRPGGNTAAAEGPAVDEVAAP